MKTIGIIAEYNPFHQGHAYQIRQAKSAFGADFVVAAISGDFVQRGEPAIFDKYTRTAMALNCGADLVVELPVEFATGSAEDFASCGVALLDKLGAVDGNLFGSEEGALAPLQAAADVLLSEPEDFRLVLKDELANGFSYPAAREKALSAALEGQIFAGIASPNNILGIEYLKALKRRSSSIKPLTLKRQGQNYHDDTMPEAGVFASASALRGILQKESAPSSSAPFFGPADPDLLSRIRQLLPPGAFQALFSEDALNAPIFADDLSGLLQYRLLSALHREDDLNRYADLSPELAARLKRLALTPASFTERINQLKAKNFTYTRISRALLHLVLGITSEDMAAARQADFISYIRILGFRKEAAPLLSAIKKAAAVPLVTKVANAGQSLSPEAVQQLNRSLYASHLYQSLVYQKGRSMNNEFTKSVIIL